MLWYSFNFSSITIVFVPNTQAYPQQNETVKKTFLFSFFFFNFQFILNSKCGDIWAEQTPLF
jgi:hypothetical protein